jgi:putative addiction module component (TIGR02574 family)
MTRETVAEFESLSVEEQIKLVQELWDRIAANPDAIPLTEAQRAELERRLASERIDPPAGIPWDEVRCRALGDA